MSEQKTNFIIYKLYILKKILFSRLFIDFINY